MVDKITNIIAVTTTVAEKSSNKMSKHTHVFIYLNSKCCHTSWSPLQEFIAHFPFPCASERVLLHSLLNPSNSTSPPTPPHKAPFPEVSSLYRIKYILSH